MLKEISQTQRNNAGFVCNAICPAKKHEVFLDSLAAGDHGTQAWPAG